MSMTETVDITAWTEALADKLQEAFGERLVLVGLQGSRARGEAREDSDIDAVVIIDDLGPADLATYKEVIATMPVSALACGFIGSPDVLKGWPRSDSFNLVMDTRVHFGSFDFMDAYFTSEEASASAKAGAAEIYHALCHTLVFEEEALPAVLAACVKSAFFVMRANVFACTGEYPASRARMRELASDEERLFLDAYDTPAILPDQELANRLLAWAAAQLEM